MSLLKLSSLLKAAEKPPISGGQHSNLPNAWNSSKKLGQRSDIPLAKGLPK